MIPNLVAPLFSDQWFITDDGKLCDFHVHCTIPKPDDDLQTFIIMTSRTSRYSCSRHIVYKVNIRSLMSNILNVIRAIITIKIERWKLQNGLIFVHAYQSYEKAFQKKKDPKFIYPIYKRFQLQ